MFPPPPTLPKPSASAAAPPMAYACPCRDACLRVAQPPGFQATAYVPQIEAMQQQIEAELEQLRLQRLSELAKAAPRAAAPPLAGVPMPEVQAQPSVLGQPIDEAASTPCPARPPNVEEAPEPSELGQPNDESTSGSAGPPHVQANSASGSAGPPNVQAGSVPCLFPTQGRSVEPSARHRPKSRNKIP